MKDFFLKIKGLGSISIALFYLIALVLIILPSYSPFTEIAYNSKRIFEIVLLILTGLAIFFNRHIAIDIVNEVHLLPKSFIVGISFIFSIGIISSLLSNYFFYAFLEVSLFFLLFTLLLFVIYFYKQREKFFIWLFLGTLATSAALYLLHFSLSYIHTFFVSGFPVWPNMNFLQLYSDGKPLFPEPFLGFVHVRYLNHIHTWSLPLFALLVIKIPGKYWAAKYLTFALFSLWWMLVFAADARGTMLASVLSVVLVLYIFRKKITNWIKIYTGSAAMGLSLYLLLFKVMQSGGREVLSRYGDSGRWQMWELGMQLVRENPLLGAGPMHYADYANAFRYAAPHNIYLQIASEWGLLAFITLAVICVFGYVKWIKYCREKAKSSHKPEESHSLNVLAALTASITAAAIHGFFSGIINTPLSQLVMILVLGWTISLYQKEKKLIPAKISDSSLNKQRVILKSVVLAVMVFVSGMTYYSYANLDESRMLYLEQSERQTLYPRFWDHGIIGVTEREIIDRAKQSE